MGNSIVNERVMGNSIVNERVILGTINWSTKDFGKSEKKETNHKVQWNDKRQPFDCTTILLEWLKKLDCQDRQDKQATAKDNKKSRRRERTGQDHVHQRNYTMFQKTKKFGCPAQIKILEITDFPDVQEEKLAF
eukprot:gene2098-2383_t